MSVCGWGSRELTSKQGTFPLIMLLCFGCWIGQYVPSYASWVEKSFSVSVFASGSRTQSCGAMGKETHGGGSVWWWRHRAGLVALCPSLLWLCCPTPNMSLVTPGITELQCDRSSWLSCGLHTIQAP